jgi:hypothetical protein
VRDPLACIKSPVASSPTPNYPVRLELDNFLDAEAELAVLRPDPDAKDPKMITGTPEGDSVKFRGDRREVLLFAVGPRGSLLFKPEVTDWTTDLDFREVYGTRYLQLTKLAGKDEPGTAKVRSSCPVIDWDSDKAEENKPADAVYRTIILDATPPVNIKFAELYPAEPPYFKLERGTLLPVKAKAEDPESRIASAVFFVGKPLPGGKILDNVETVAGVFNDKTGNWEAEVKIPSDQKGVYDVSVRFTNGAGLSEIKTVRVQLVDSGSSKDGGAGAGKLGQIEGMVVEGDRPQANVEVALRDEKNNLKASTKTDEAGKYVLKDIPAGAYKVVAAKSAAKTKGETPVSIEGGDKKVGVNIKLMR